ncbi:MAG: hypothetical protein IJO43_02130 [Bacilli bacterium]|nr:hypothetical protein [Bacilli bacterium]
MKKNILYLMILIAMFFVNVEVDAESHDVTAKYEMTHNVVLFEETLNDGSVEIDLGNYSLEFSSTLKNIKIVLIKAEGDANNYAKAFTKNNENYYLLFYKNGQKITTGSISVTLKENNKVLKVYDNDGEVIESSSENIFLNSNNYFITITNGINDDESGYKVIDVNSSIDDFDEVNEDSMIEVYNSKNVKVDDYSNLGTGYKVIITNQEETIEYIIIVKGEVTGDAKINLNDVTRLYHYYKNIIEMDDIFVLAGDVAGQNTINLNDVTKLYHYYKGIISNL